MHVMKNKIVLVTGSSSGIGKQAAIELAALGATVLVHTCTAGKGREVMESLYNELPTGSFDLFVANFEDQQEVHRMAMEIKAVYGRLDVLVNNAAIFLEERKLSRDTIEKMFAVNHLSPFLLTHLLLPLLQKSVHARIINVSSNAHYTAAFEPENLQGEKQFTGLKRYCATKLCNLLFTYHLSSLLKDQNISVNALHPGFTNTGLYQQLFGQFDGSPLSESAGTIVYLASSAVLQNTTGLYFTGRLPVASSAVSYERKYQRQLWKLSERLTLIHSNKPKPIKHYWLLNKNILLSLIMKPVKMLLSAFI